MMSCFCGLTFSLLLEEEEEQCVISLCVFYSMIIIGLVCEIERA